MTSLCAEDIIRLTERKFDYPEEAITALQAAIEAEPKHGSWPVAEDRRLLRGKLLLRLGDLYFERRKGDRADNLEQALAAYVHARDAFPDKERVFWAQVQHNLGRAYIHRIRGERADDLEKAIVACEAALAVRTRDTFPTDWAKTQHNLAAAYGERILGDRADNLERAIALCETAQVVRR